MYAQVGEAAVWPACHRTPRPGRVEISLAGLFPCVFLQVSAPAHKPVHKPLFWCCFRVNSHTRVAFLRPNLHISCSFSTRNGLSAELEGFGGLLERTTSGVWHHEDRDTPLWLLSPTHTTNGTSQPKKQLRPESERPQQPPPCACGRRAVRAAVCGVGRSCAHTNTQLTPPRWLCSQCRPSARRWVWMPVDVAACDCAAARRHGADDTRSCDRKARSADDKKQ